MRLPSDATLLVVDAAAAVATPAPPGMPGDVDACIRVLVDVWRSRELPVVVAAGEEAVEPGVALDGIEVVRRAAASAFVDTGLDEQLTAGGCTTLVVCGHGMDAGVEASVRHAADLGFRLFVVGDACTCQGGTDMAGRTWCAQDLHELALARMARAGARIVDWRAAWIAAKGAGWGRKG